ncbi:restriction endonuclease subunit S [Sphingomonas sp. Mn802worker]|uniref:restriction endonuclease subunit S n=1 Tax=Sphingomonas sp. Mn802worker TaxID=629773 RepID=UPI0003751D51|nr:restriction endonuclease subunit S [Sphingomonas sp. Mn802worker]
MPKKVAAAGPIEGPWALPEGWRWERLGNVADRIADKHKPDPTSVLPFVGMDAIAPRSMVVSATQPFGQLRSAGAAFKKGDVLYGRLRPYLNKVWHANYAGACSGEFIVIRPSADVDAQYLTVLLHSDAFVEFASHAVTGDRPRIDFNTMAAFPVPLPPIDIQGGIIARVGELFAEIDDGDAALARARDDLATWRKALLKAAVTGELTADWRAANRHKETGADLLTRILANRRSQWAIEPSNRGKRYKEPEAVSAAGLPNIPDSWVWTNVDSILVGGIQNGLYLPQSAYGDGHPILRIDDFQSGTARPSAELRLVSTDIETTQTYALKAGDLVVNRVNSMTHLAKSFLVRDHHVPALFESNMMRMKPSEMLDLDYFEYYISSDIGRSRLCRNAKAAVNQASVNQTDVKTTPIPLPSREEQNVIATRVESLMAEAEAGADNLIAMSAHSVTLRQSILAAAFRGELA